MTADPSAVWRGACGVFKARLRRERAARAAVARSARETVGLRMESAGRPCAARCDYEVLAVLRRCGALDGSAHCCFCSAVKFQGKNVVASGGGVAPLSAQAVR